MAADSVVLDPAITIEDRTFRQGQATKLWRILRSRLRATARVDLIRVAVQRQLGARPLVWRPGPARVRLEPDSADIDWHLVLDIFIDGDYETDYHGAAVVDLGAHKGFF